MSGSQVSAHSRRLAKQDPEKYGHLVPKEGPEAPITGPLAYLLDWYDELRAAQQRGFRVEPVSFTEILAFGQLYDVEIDPFDAQTLRRLDGVWLKSLPEDKPSPKR